MFTSWFRARGARRRAASTGCRPRRLVGPEALEGREVPAVFTVNTVADAPDANLADGVADTDLATRGLQTSLRAAIQQANATPGADTIRFAIPGVSAQTIRPLTALPTITETVTIDGYSQPGAAANTLSIGDGTNAQLRVELNGSLITDGSSGLVVEGHGSTIRGLVINGFGYPDLGDPGSPGHVPVGGIVLLGDGGHTVAGNFIGTDHRGTGARPNNFYGVYVSSSENVIGGSTPEARNLISGNQGFGVYLTARSAPDQPEHRPAEHNRVMGNLIGTDRTGTAAVANTGGGVVLSTFARRNAIGGLGAEERNVISGNGGPHSPYGDPDGPYQDWPDAPYALSGGHGSGIHIESLTLLTLTGHSVPNTIIGNNVVTNARGTAALPNQLHGVLLVFTNETTVSHNLISGNVHSGVALGGQGLDPTHFRVQHNRIGTDATGALPVGNGQNGVHVVQASDNRVYFNTIAFNGASGVSVQNSYNPATGVVYTSAFNTISRNSIHSNALLGLDLVRALGPDADGPTANDPLDADVGPNGLRNFPVITSAGSGASTVVNGWLHGLPGTAHRLEFFASAAADPSGHGEGQRFLGAVVVTTNGAGNAAFSVSGLAPTAFGEYVSATATDLAGLSTSEFSRAVRLAGQPGLAVEPHIDLPVTEPPVFEPPCDPLRLVFDPSVIVMEEYVAVREGTTHLEADRAAFGVVAAGSDGVTETLDALLAAMAKGQKARGPWGVDLSHGVDEGLALALA